jgi:hypothetical protein
MKKIVINKNKNQLINENKIKSDSVLYLLINAIIEIADNGNIESDFINIIKRYKENNYKKFKEINEENGVKIIEIE